MLSYLRNKLLFEFLDLLWSDHAGLYVLCTTKTLIIDFSGSKVNKYSLYPPVTLCWRLKCRHTQADVSQQPTRLVIQGF